MRPNKSTTVRMISGLVRTLPTAGNAVLGELFLRAPSRMQPTTEEAAVLARATRRTVATSVGAVAAYEWEGEGPSVLLVHGHGGAASQMTSFVAKLRERGHRVVAYDAPAHGASPGSHSSLVIMGRALADVIAGTGPYEAVIAHSLGAAATSLAARFGADFDRAVLVAPPSDVRTWFARFVSMFDLDERTQEKLALVIEGRVGMPMQELRAEALGPHVRARTLVIHDRRDKEVAFASGEATVRSIAGARMIATEGLGHRRILADEGVVLEAVRFATDRKSVV